MEQVYVIKLKELPQPTTLSTSNTTSVGETTINGIKVNSPFEGKDLNRRALFGFSAFQLILGLLSIIFSLIGANKDWTHSFGVFTGIVYIITAIGGILVSEGVSSPLQSSLPSSTQTSLPWASFSRSSTFLWITLLGQFITLIISTLFTWLTMFGIICALNSTINLQTSLVTANGLQFIFALLSSFVLSRILNPNFLAHYVPSWPDKPKVSSKIIVKTSIYPRVLRNDNFSRLLGPNCIVSLVPPNNNHMNRQVTVSDTTQAPKMQDQATETEPESQYDDLNILSSTPNYFSRSSSPSPSVSTTSISIKHFSIEIEPETPIISEFDTFSDTKIAKQKSEFKIEPELQVEIETETETESGSEKVSSSSPSTESDSEQDSCSSPEMNDQMKCKSIGSDNLHRTISTPTTTAIH